MAKKGKYRQLDDKYSGSDNESGTTGSDESAESTDSGSEGSNSDVGESGSNHHHHHKEKHSGFSSLELIIGLVLLLLASGGIFLVVHYLSARASSSTSLSTNSTASSSPPLTSVPPSTPESASAPPPSSSFSTATSPSPASPASSATPNSDPFPTSTSQSPTKASPKAPAATPKPAAANALDDATSSSGDRVWPAVAMSELKTLVPSQLGSVWSAVQAAASQYTLQGQLLVAIAMVESTGCSDPSAYSNGGGCWQFTDEDTWNEYSNGAQRSDNSAEATAAAHYISDLISQDGNIYSALRDYNGPVGQGGDPSYQSNVASYMLGKNYG